MLVYFFDYPHISQKFKSGYEFSMALRSSFCDILSVEDIYGHARTIMYLKIL